MKNYIKLFGIIALAAVIGISMTACDDDSDDNDGGGYSGTIRAGYMSTYEAPYSTYYVRFTASYGPSNGQLADDIVITITTDLPSPNDQFTLTNTARSSGDITGLEEDQEVKWRATVNKGSLSTSNDRQGGTVYFGAPSY